MQMCRLICDLVVRIWHKHKQVLLMTWLMLSQKEMSDLKIIGLRDESFNTSWEAGYIQGCVRIFFGDVLGRFKIK